MPMRHADAHWFPFWITVKLLWFFFTVLHFCNWFREFRLSRYSLRARALLPQRSTWPTFADWSDTVYKQRANMRSNTLTTLGPIIWHTDQWHSDGGGRACRPGAAFLGWHTSFSIIFCRLIIVKWRCNKLVDPRGNMPPLSSVSMTAPDDILTQMSSNFSCSLRSHLYTSY